MVRPSENLIHIDNEDINKYVYSDSTKVAEKSMRYKRKIFIVNIDQTKYSALVNFAVAKVQKSSETYISISRKRLKKALQKLNVNERQQKYTLQKKWQRNYKERTYGLAFF